MRKIKITLVIVPAVIFLTTLVLIMFNVFEKDPTNTLSTKNIIIYLINISFWISAAYLINKLSMVFFWSNLLKQPGKNALAKLLYRVFSMLMYTFALALIMFGVLTFIIPETYWFIILLLFFVGGVLFYDKITDLFGTNRLNFEGSYNLGDWIELINSKNGVKVTGKVLDFTRKEIILQTPDNGVAFIPNDLKNESIVVNYDSLDVKNEFKVCVTVHPSVPIEQVKRILTACEKQYFLNNPIDKYKNAVVTVSNIGEKGIEYTLTFYIKPFKDAVPSAVKDAIYTNIVSQFAAAGILLNNGVFEYYCEGEHTLINKIIKGLKNIVLFGALNNNELLLLASGTAIRKVKEGEILIKQGEPGSTMFILSEGLLSANVTEQEKEIRVGLISPGTFFGEMSLLTGEKRTATIKAECESVAYEIGKESIEKIIKARPEVLNEIAEVVTERQRANLLKLEEFHNRKENLSTYMLNKIKDFLHMH